MLSDRIVQDSRWSEWIPKRTLTQLEVDEALAVLDARLEEADLSVEITAARKKEVVRDLDFNPRAIEALVGALRYESLDHIIQSNPGLWAVHDREVSREFLRALERDLLERTLRHLGEEYHRKLWQLAVHRRSFQREALEKLCTSKDEANELRYVLLSRYLLNFHRGSLSLNPIVREISLNHLREDSAKFRQAHSSAVNYHLRHFTAKQIVVSQAKLGESFAELRYHLVQAGREEELGVIGHRFTNHLKREIQSGSPVPTNPEELNERIGILTILLETGGAKGLEYHLARCLQDRGQPGDLDQAILHARRATDRGIAPSWILCAELLAQDGQVDQAVQLLQKGIEVIPPDKNLFSLYQRCADLMAQNGQTDQAVQLLQKGIQVIPPDKNLFSLYQICANLMAQNGQTDQAVQLLQKGIQVIPPDKSLFSLYQILGQVHCMAGRLDDAIAAVREGIGRIPKQFSQYKLCEGLLYLCLASGDEAKLSAALSAQGVEQLGRSSLALGKVLQCQMRGDWVAAADTAATARREFPRFFALASMEAFSRLAAGDAEAAWRALISFPNLKFSAGQSQSWLQAFIHLRRGDRAEAAKSLATYLDRPIDESRELTESFLLRLWDQQEIAPESNRLCFYFPIMPPSLTGLSHTVRRVQFGNPVLPTPSGALTPETSLSSPTTPAPSAPTEIYVSYAWGEDTTEPGRQREEIVDRLCRTVGASGRGIGRDKERMRGGDSIERFAQEISKAKRIIAVISEKSLHSEFCMAHELFRAFRRCDYQRAEFQEKVIALIMDDAKPYLKDNLAIVELAKKWRGRLEKLKAEFQTVDPNRKSPHLWIFVDMVDEMCPRLPDMLNALRDIVMQRGFDEIVDSNFEEVLSRLPPPTGS